MTMTMIILFSIGWFVSGFGTFLWLRRGSDLTWGELVVAGPLSGAAGPIFFAVVALIILAQCEFWSKPVFRKRGQ